MTTAGSSCNVAGSQDSPKGPSPFPVAWWGSLVGLLAAELALIWFCTDLGQMVNNWIVKTHFFDWSQHRTRLIIGGGSLLLTAIWASKELKRKLWQLSGPRESWWMLGAHLVAFAVLTTFLGLMSRELVAVSPERALFRIAGLALGLVWLALWCSALVSFRYLPMLVCRGAAVLAITLALGAGVARLGTFTRYLWKSQVGDWTLWQVYYCLHLFCEKPVLVAERYIVGMPDFQVEVSSACSGYQGIGLIWAFLGGYLWLFRQRLRFPQALLLLPLGTLLIWVANTLRIVALILIGAWISPEIAIDGFHSQAGWIAFLAVSLGLIAFASRRPFFTTVAPPVEIPEEVNPTVAAASRANPTAVFLMPLLVLTAVTMFTQAFSSGFNWMYPLRVVAVGAALWHFRREYLALNWKWSWSAVGIGAAGFALWIGLEPLLIGTPTTPQSSGLETLGPVAAGLWLVFRVIGSVFTVPIAEELAFRGYLTRRLIGADFEQVPVGEFSWLSLLVSSAAFGALHGQRWIAGMLVGVLFALALYRRRQLADAVVAHATTNALLSAYVLATGSWSLW